MDEWAMQRAWRDGMFEERAHDREFEQQGGHEL